MTLDELVEQEAMQPWEVSLLKVLEPEKADPREIIVVWDGVGSNNKSGLTKKLVDEKDAKLNGLATYSRHVGQLKEGGAIGASLFFLVQSYKCQSGGLNKVVRNQCTALMVFRTKDAAELDDIAS